MSRKTYQKVLDNLFWFTKKNIINFNYKFRLKN